MDLDRAYRISPNAAVRPENFGGLVYRHDNRRLYFIYSPELVELLTGLEGLQSLKQALDGFLAGRSLAGSREALVNALERLLKSGVLVEV